ncbi:MAG: radical SAM protein [Candidatus Odinarchaeia archaeon]
MKQLPPLVNEHFWKCRNPFYYKVTLNEKTETIYIYNYGCNWNCRICTYRLKTPAANKIKVENIVNTLKKYSQTQIVKRVSFVGGEPLCNPNATYLMETAVDLGFEVTLGHTNLSIFPPNFITEVTVGIKAITEEKYRYYTGAKSSNKIFKNIEKCFSSGIKVKTNIVLVPEFIDTDEIEKVAIALSQISKSIPLRIVGYIPVPGFITRKPTVRDLEEAVAIAKKHIHYVSWSLPEYPDYRIQLCRSQKIL